MDPAFYHDNSFRPPQWRADRAMQMVAHRPSRLLPSRFDDSYVRLYRRFLLSLAAAGDDEAARAAIQEPSHVYQAQLLRFNPNRQLRQVLEARLLTHESLADIAHRLGTDALTVDFYEKLFFNIRDRMHNKDWIAKIIVGKRGSAAPDDLGTITEDQRGYLYKVFAYRGGPLVLEALITGIGSRPMPQRLEDVAAWFDEALSQHVQTRATSAAATLATNTTNALDLLKLALAGDRQRTRTAAKSRSKDGPVFDDSYFEKVVAALERSMGEETLHKPGSDGAKATKPSQEPPQ